MASERSLQTAVFHLELGRGKVVVRWAVVVLAAITLSLVYTANQFRGLEKREAMDAAQLARNLSRGEGFTTSVIRPVALWHLKTYRSDHNPTFEQHPDTYNPPLYPLALAVLFRLTPQVFEVTPGDQLYPPERWVIVPFNQVCLLLTLLLVYFWACRLFDRRVAITAGLLLLLSDTLWSYGVSGLSTTMLMLLLLGGMYCLFLADERLNPPEPGTPVALDSKSMLLIFSSAVLMGLCFLTRYSALVFVIPMAIYTARILRGRRGGFWVGVYLMVVLAVIAPWLVRNYAVAHSVLGTARYQFFSSEIFERTYKVTLGDFWSVRSIAARFLGNLHHLWVDEFRVMGTDILVFFFVVGVMYGFRRSDASRLRLVVLGCLAVALVGMAVVGLPYEPVEPAVNGGNLLVPLLPLVAMFGAAFFYLLLDRIPFQMQLTRGAAIGVFVLLNIAPMIFTILPPRRAPFPYPPYCQMYLQLLSKWYAKSDVGVSDAPWMVAWYVDRRTVWLPVTLEEYFEIHDFVAPHHTQFVLLTPYMLDRRFQSDLVNGEFKPWATIARGQLPDLFPLRTATLLPPNRDQILLTDRARWKEHAETNALDQALKQFSK